IPPKHLHFIIFFIGHNIYEQKCDELEKQKKDLNFKNSALEKEKADIVDFLRYSLLAKEEEVERLSERLDNVQQTAQREREEMQRQHSTDTEQLQNQAGTLTVENKALGKSACVVFQKINCCLTNPHASSMEAEVQRLVTQRLPETTSVALQENQQLKECCSLLSEHTQGLVLKNTALHNKKTVAELDVLEQLTDKCALLQTELNQCRQKHQQLHSLHSHSLDEMETLRQDKASVFKECNQNQRDISRLEAELQQEQRKRRITMSESYKLIGFKQEADVEESKEHVDKWKLLMQKLLVILDHSEYAKVEVLFMCFRSTQSKPFYTICIFS
uniref:Uncharacterized protein n=1 Tax=Neogobius melanostomus TaxID=47308 RepID=A0A8C6TKA1_9GOBI